MQIFQTSTSDMELSGCGRLGNWSAKYWDR